MSESKNNIDSANVDFVSDDLVVMSTEYFDEEAYGDMRFRLAGSTFGMKAAANGTCLLGYWVAYGMGAKDPCRVDRYQIDFAKTNDLWEKWGREKLRS